MKKRIPLIWLIIIIVILIIISIFLMLIKLNFIKTKNVDNKTSNEIVAEDTQSTDISLLEYSDNLIININFNQPDSDEITYIITNPSSSTILYQVNMVNITSDFEENNLSYTVTSSSNLFDKVISIAECTMENEDFTIIPIISIKSNETQIYKIKISSLTKGKFTGQIQLNNIENSTYLSNNIVQNYNIMSDENTKFEYAEPRKFGITSTGIYQTEDNDGITYYLRGDIKDNYVSFANLLWRVVRINGDGTIRLILDNRLSEAKAYNEKYKSHKYVGYTYNNKTICTYDNPCISTYDSKTQTFISNTNYTSSTIKNYLENEWYMQTLSEFDDYIALTTFCNDTSVSISEDDYIYYSAYRRIRMDYSPSLKCNDTENTYGGYYKLKVGLITADELNMIGFAHSTGNKYLGTEDNYLYTGYSFLTLTPRDSYKNYAFVYSASGGKLYIYSYVNYESSIRPVINLNSTVKIEKGNGTKDNPYVISTN